MWAMMATFAYALSFDLSFCRRHEPRLSLMGVSCSLMLLFGESFEGVDDSRKEQRIIAPVREIGVQHL